MQYRVLGKTGLKVSVVGFGGWAIGGDAYKGYGPTDDAVSLAALNQAYELGCNFFDTADVYGWGKSEALIGQALKGWRRDEVVIASKVGFVENPNQDQQARQLFSDQHIRQACEASLKRLQIDCIDVYQLHNPTLELIQLGRLFNVLKELQTEGKIRHYGISIHDPQEGIQAVDIGNVQTIQAIYNLFDRRAEQGLFAKCEQDDVGLIVREPFARGFLTGRFDPARAYHQTDNRAVWPKPLVEKRAKAATQYQQAVPEGYPNLGSLAIQFALSQPSVSVVIPGCKTPAQVMENFAAANLSPLTPDDLAQINRLQQLIF